MADFVWPEDTGTGAAQGDDNDAANFATAYHAVGLKNYVVQGLGFTLNAGTPSLDIGSGKAVVDDPSATATQSSETRNEGVSYVAEMDARTGISLTDSAVNHVFLQVDLSTDDTINIVVNTTNSAPSEPQVKLGTVDTSNDTTTELNRDIPVDLGNLSSKTFSELSNASISSASAGQTILYDATNSEFVNASISAGTALGSSSSDGSFTLNVQESNIDHDNLTNFVSNEHVDHSSVTVTGTGALTGGGDLTSSRTLDVASNGIGTDELDESANFDFSSAISFTGGIDGGGSAIDIDENIDIENSNSIRDGSGNKHLTINDGGKLGINRDFDTNANNLFVNGNQSITFDSSGSIGILQDDLEFKPGASGAGLTFHQDSTNENVHLFTGGTGGTNKLKISANSAVSDGANASLSVSQDFVGVRDDATQPGSSGTPAVQIGDSGAGFYIDGSGEVVVVDEAGNTTKIS